MNHPDPKAGPKPYLRFPNPIPVPKWKRTLDMALLALSAPIALPVVGLAALWVSMVSPGKLFFVQERVGQAGRRFRCFKLRTMHENCPTTVHQQLMNNLLQQDQPMVKLDHVDPRLIPGAKVLRALGVDELPQLWNVVQGEMSFVGPRPCVPYELEQYLPTQLERFAALPGLTGHWQVKGKNNTTFSQMIQLDIEYTRQQSLFRDVWILLATPKTLLSQIFGVFRKFHKKPSATTTSNSSKASKLPMITAGGSAS